MKNPMRDFLSRLRWDKKMKGRRYVVRFVSRGAPGGFEEVLSDEIVRVSRDGFVFEREGEEKWIPYHRVLEIRERETGRLVFSREKKVYDFKP